MNFQFIGLVKPAFAKFAGRIVEIEPVPPVVPVCSSSTLVLGFYESHGKPRGNHCAICLQIHRAELSGDTGLVSYSYKRGNRGSCFTNCFSVSTHQSVG